MGKRLEASIAAVRAWYASHSVRDQRILLGVVALAALSAVYLGVLAPLWDFRARVSAEIDAGQQELERAARFLGAMEALRAERGALEKKLQQARGRLLPGRSGTLGAAALQELTNALSAEKGVTIQSTQVMKEEAIDPYRKVSIRLTLSGELKPFAEMVSALEHGHQLAIPFVEITRRGAVAGAKGPRMLSATMEVTGFVLAEEPKAEDVSADADGAAGGEGTPGDVPDPLAPAGAVVDAPGVGPGAVPSVAPDAPPPTGMPTLPPPSAVGPDQARRGGES